MKQRKLFQAKDASGILHYIEKLDKEKLSYEKTEFFCPHCGKEVKPKMGKRVAWHFAHIGQTCDALKSKPAPTANANDSEIPPPGTKDIWSFTKKFTVGSDFSIDPKSCQCEICRTIQGKEYAVRWNDKIYICKRCYSQLSKEKIQELQWRTMI